MVFSKPISALAALLILSNHANAFSTGVSSFPRAVVSSTKLAMGGGGMDAYDAQLAAMTGASPAVVEKVAAEMLDSSRAAATAAGGGGATDAVSAIAALEASQTQTVAKIASSIPDLALKPDQSYSPASTSPFTVAGHAVKLDASDAIGNANIAWLSDLCIDETMSSLTVYNGPLTDVPHLISRCAVTDAGLNFFLDFRPRAYG